LAIPVEPAVKKPSRRFVPAARVPQAVESVGWALNRPDRGDQGGRRIAFGPARFFRIDTACKLEQSRVRRATGTALARCGPKPRGRLAPRGLVRSTCTRSR
jgi:hypothetical protein